MPEAQPLTVRQLHQQLQQILPADIHSCDAKAAIEPLATLPRSLQEYVLNWISRLTSTNIQIGFQFACKAAELVVRQDLHIIDTWLWHTLDIYDVSGIEAALEVIHNVDSFLHYSHEHSAGVVLEEEQGVLQHFLQGLSGRRMTLAEGEQPYTDSETLYLPPIVAMLPSTTENFKLVKAMVAFQWAQNRFGSFRQPLLEQLQLQDDDAFLPLYQAIDNLRLELCLQQVLPGLFRDLQALRQAMGEKELPAKWQAIRLQLQDNPFDAEQVMTLTREHLGSLQGYKPRSYQPSLRYDEVVMRQNERIEKEQARLKVALDALQQELVPDTAPQTAVAGEPPFQVDKVPDSTQPEGFRIELSLNGTPVAMPEGVKNLISSVMMDLDELPPDYLVPAAASDYDPRLLHDEESTADGAVTSHEQGTFFYKEWDHQRQHYRKNWCAVRELVVKPRHDDFVRSTRQKYAPLIQQLNKTFEAMRDEDKLLKKQPEGEDIDIDALVEALADHHAGQEMGERLFTRMHRSERNIAVCFMVDMSGSTQGWINEAEREALILLCEALEHVGDRYAIYGFSGQTRKRCEIYRIKAFDERYSDEVRSRISGIEPKDYTRMGFAIRHLSSLLSKIDAHNRILITLSDGKPDDSDNYRGEYGIEDTRKALIEARQDGIHPYCITIDKSAHDYLPHMYGAVSYTVLDDISLLPYKVSDIYKRLTS